MPSSFSLFPLLLSICLHTSFCPKVSFSLQEASDSVESLLSEMIASRRASSSSSVSRFPFRLFLRSPIFTHSICPAVCLVVAYLTVRGLLSVCLSVGLSIYCLCVCISVYLSIYSSIGQSGCQSGCLYSCFSTFTAIPAVLS